MSDLVALIGKKVGMLGMYDEKMGHILPVTIVQVDRNIIHDIKTVEIDGYDAVVVASCETQKEDKLKKPQVGIFKKKNSSLFRKVKEFRSPSSLEEFRSLIGSDCFVTDVFKGKYLDITGVSIGKGFQGPMKRWGFHGLRASHGVSVSHRSHGSIGHRTDPGKVFKGKKMAGHMGHSVIVQQNVLVSSVDVNDGLLFLHGSLPGKNGSLVLIRDAVRKRGLSKPSSINGLLLHSNNNASSVSE
ncbi:MAG: 50S ribosomal protein L3 [Alphaproteobacteria bacterium]|nr:50S ribosomal protein L3 [Rickettsiales bacterium]